MKVLVLMLSVAALAAACGGSEDLERTTTIQSALEPAIPSCSDCQLRHQLFTGRARVTGTFSTVDTSIWVGARVGLPSGTTVPIALPTGGSYDQTITVGSKPASANMQFQYRTAGGDLRWATSQLNLPVAP
jgi:hypothetical protein